MPRYRKKPIVVSATQWFIMYDHAMVTQYRAGDRDGDMCDHCGRMLHVHGWIDMLEGGLIVCPGDWVITEVVGAPYPCKDAIFRETYEEV